MSGQQRARAQQSSDAPQGSGSYMPVDADAEVAVLAAIFTSPEAYFDASLILEPEDFGIPANGEIYRAVVACDNSGRPFDPITVADQLKKAGMLDKVGGMKRLELIAAQAGEVANVNAHAEIISEKALLRRLVTTGRAIAGDAMQPENEAKESLARAESLVFELGKSKTASSLVEMPKAVADMLEELKKSRKSLLVGHSTGFTELDKMTGGLQGGQLVIVAARPGAGKSAFGLQLARHIAEASGLMVPFLSYEMSTNELSIRMLAGALEYDLHKLRQGDLPAGMDLDLAREAEKMAGLPVLIDDNPPETIGGVRSEMRRLARRGQVGAVVIDYLQLMSAEGKFKDANRTQEVSEISRGLKRLANELDVPVIALSQLNRSLESRPNKRPMLSDLRESGSLEQDASLVLFLYRDYLYNPSADPQGAECIIGKQRNGPQGTIPLQFLGPSTKFKDGVARVMPPSGNGKPPADGGLVSPRPF